MTIVDSSVWIDFFNGRDTPETNTLDLTLGVDPVALGDLMLVEVLQGFRSDAHYRTARRLLTSLPVFEMLGTARAIMAAQLFRTLRRRGITTRKTNDVIIAAFCLAEGHKLLYSDRDFDPFVDHFGLVSAGNRP